MSAKHGKPWQQWNESDWNAALFEHYFRAGDEDTPITRLVVTGRELALAAACERAQAEAVEDGFVRVVTRAPRWINKRYSRGYFAFPPSPFQEAPAPVLYLLFTCYVACGCDEVVREGDFRRRMACVLGHAEGTAYPLQGLPDLWRQLQRWLVRARKVGCTYRELALPDPGWRTLIGHTLGLVFPSRRDQVVLNEIIPEAGFAVQPPIPALLRLLGRHRNMFSEAFNGAFELFREEFHSGTVDFTNSPLLDAVQEAMEQSRAEAGSISERPNLRLMAEADEQGRLVLALLTDRREIPAGDPRLSVTETECGLEGHRFALVFGGTDADAMDSVIHFLLADELASMLHGFGATPLCHAAGEGVLLFHRGPTGILECSMNLNVDGAVCILVRHDLVAEFRAVLAPVSDAPAQDFTSAYEDWREFVGIDVAVLRLVNWDESGVLSDVRCLQPCPPPGRISLAGGISTGEASTFFGYASVLPLVRVQGKASAVVIANSEGAIQSSRELIPLEANQFKIPMPDPRDALEGEYVIEAQKAGDGFKTLRKIVRFRTVVDCLDYSRPSNPEKWWCESSWEDMSPCGADGLFAGAPEPTGPTQTTRVSAAIPAAPTNDDEVAARVATLTEICAAIANRRCGFADQELFELFRTVLGLEDMRLVRPVIRSWVEAGHFDDAVSLSWRTRRFLARHPRLVVRTHSAGLRARLAGLSPRVLVNRLRGRAEAMGGQVGQCASASRWLAGPWEICGLDLEPLRLLCGELCLGEPVWAPAGSALIPESNRLERRLKERPINYDVVKTWRWESRSFIEPGSNENGAVQVLWCRREERSDRPDYYVVSHQGADAFVTYSRNWALLVAAKLAGVQPYLHGTHGTLKGEGRPWVFLPLSIGRFAFAAGGGAAGLGCDPDGRWQYAYPVGSDALADDLLARLGFGSGRPACEMPGWLSRLAAARTRCEPLVPLASGSLARQKVPVSLRPVMLAHLRRSGRRRN